LLSGVKVALSLGDKKAGFREQFFSSQLGGNLALPYSRLASEFALAGVSGYCFATRSSRDEMNINVGNTE
jgi:hypothetical protein